MGLLENPKLPIILFAGVISVVGVTFYLNTRFNFVDVPLFIPDTPEVIIDYPSITTHPTFPGATSKPSATNPTSSIPRTTTTPIQSPDDPGPTEAGEQNVQVIASFLDKAIICPVSKEAGAKEIIKQTEDKLKPVVEEYNRCNDRVGQEFQACINSCSSYLDVACTENCGQTYDPQFGQCDGNYQNKRTALITSAKQELGQTCIVL